MADSADIADLNPAFTARLDPFLAALTKAGIANRVISGYRSPELQSRLYANFQAKQAGRPLPFPQENQGAIAAPPWRSFHNYGLAADVTPVNPANYSRMWSMAPQFGLTALGAKDYPHFQMAGGLDEDISQYHLANWRPESQPAPASGAIAYAGPSGQPSRVASTTPGTSINSSPMDIVATLESGNRNIAQQIEDKNTLKGTPAGGFFQIIDPTWRTYAAAAGVDVNQYPTAMRAPRDIQAKVASAIPVNQWGPKTVAALKAKYPGIDTSQTLGAFQSQALGAPTLAAGGAPAPTAPGQPGQPSTGLAGSLPGFAANSPGAKMTAAGLQSLGLDKGGGKGGGAGQDQPPDIPTPPMQPAQAMGGPMMMGPGGQWGAMGQRLAQQQLAQQGYMAQPSLAAFTPGMPRQPMMAPGAATGMPSMPGTTLNSPSQLQMALMTGAMNPYDLYSGAYGGGGFSQGSA